MKLRPYQQETNNLLRGAIKSGSLRTILCAPTGSGKTVMFSDIIHKASERRTITLVLTDRIELFEQTLRAVGENAQKLNASTKTKDFDNKATITIAMVETYKRRNLEGYEPKLIIVDEAHKQSFNKVFDKHPNAIVIGATATPEGKHLFQYYQKIVCSIDIPELVSQGFLSPCRAFQMQDDFSDLKVKRGEYTDASLFNHFNDRKLYSGLIDKWKEKAVQLKTIVFNVNIEHTTRTNQSFLDAGFSSAMITSKTLKSERVQILKDFTAGRIQILNNCGILTTGYDEPSIECVVLNRKTKSLPLYLQMSGRGSRIFPNKKEFIVLDFGQNHSEHGLWNEPRNWELNPPKKKKKADAPVKDCPICEAMNYASARFCMACEYEFPQKEKETPLNGVLVEVSKRTPEPLKGRRISSLTIDELIDLQKSKRFKSTFIWRIMRHKDRSEREDYRKKMNYTTGWQRYQTQKSALPFQDYLLK